MIDRYIGLMSGTSADGVDAVLIEFAESEASGFIIQASSNIIYPSQFRQKLLQLALEPRCDKHQLGHISAQLADFFAEAVDQLLTQTGLDADQIHAIGSHGHTIDHAPNNDLPYTLQITDHARLTEKTGITVICDFRSRDVAAGGQGAPLVPAFHNWLYQQQHADIQGKAVVNIGGISNLTLLKNGSGYDCGPGNCLIDSWHQRHTGEAYDHGGNTARQGKLIPQLLQRMLQDEYFARPEPKSTGREYFNEQWLHRQLAGEKYPWHDVAYTLTALTAEIISAPLVQHGCDTVYFCGGGAHNQLLMELIATRTAPMTLKTTHQLGIDPDDLEAAAFAWLARQTLLKLPGNLPSATGAKGPRILGAIYPA